jgi:hypothetical protein
VEVYHPDGGRLAEPDELPLTRATRDGEIVVNEPWVLRRADGRRIDVLCNADPIQDEDGRIR